MSRPVAAGPLALYGSLATRRIVFPEAGDFMPGHEHAYDHITFIVQGAVLFHRDDAPEPDRTVTAPDFAEAPAQARHRMTALAPGTVAYCVFAIPDGVSAERAAS